MGIKGLRQERGWSQEQLADVSGLSLRTIQRLEGSDKVSIDSLADLAAAFKIDVAALRRELAMDKTSSEWKQRPAWVKGLFLGSSRIQMDRQQHKKVELVAIVAGVALVTAGVLGTLGKVVLGNAVVPLLIFGSLLVLGAYLMSISVRVGDEYSVWQFTRRRRPRIPQATPRHPRLAEESRPFVRLP